MKCQRCGKERVVFEGKVIEEATGPDAIVTLRLKGQYGIATAKVCGSCGPRLQRLGWG